MFARWLELWRRWTGRSSAPQPLGRRAEALAADYLAAHGMRIVERSWRSPLGEIDLVGIEMQTIVFVEVRSRVGRSQGEPWETIRQTKRRKVSALAVDYLKRHPASAGRQARFDVVSVVWGDPAGRSHELEHFPSAFPLEGPWRP